MVTVDPEWSLDAFLRWYNPHERWRRWFAEAYANAVESGRPEERLRGWRTAAIIFGDMHAPVFCLFVCHHGRSLVPPDSRLFLGNIDLCLWEMGLATPAPTYEGSMPVVDIGAPETFRRDTEAAREWLAEQLRPFGGSVERAAVFAMRYTAVRFGLLRGPSEPSIEQVAEESLWERRECEAELTASTDLARGTAFRDPQLVARGPVSRAMALLRRLREHFRGLAV